MYNPLVDNLSELKTVELEAKITELTKKYFIAQSTNPALAQQIQN